MQEVKYLHKIIRNKNVTSNLYRHNNVCYMERFTPSGPYWIITVCLFLLCCCCCCIFEGRGVWLWRGVITFFSWCYRWTSKKKFFNNVAFAKINPCEIFSYPLFAKINPRKIFENPIRENKSTRKLIHAKINPTTVTMCSTVLPSQPSVFWTELNGWASSWFSKNSLFFGKSEPRDS